MYKDKHENEFDYGFDPMYDPGERAPLPGDEDAPMQLEPVPLDTDEDIAAFQRELEERQRFTEEHIICDDGTYDNTADLWFSSLSLLRRELPPIRYFVDGLLPQGLALLAAPPKYGKSWLALDLCVSVARGEPFLGRKTTPCDTLYLALEDSKNRLQTRIADVCHPGVSPENFYCGLEAGTIGNRLPHHLAVHMRRHPNTGLIVIDTFQKVRDGGGRAGADVYARDYRDVGALKAFADEHGICILLVHHLRKAGDSSDPFARISGTNGIFGAADTALVMTRGDRADNVTTLSATGRDVMADDIEMQFDKQNYRWHVLEDRACRIAEERYRADPVVQTALRLAADNPGGWQGTASELTGFVKEFTGVSRTAVSVSKQLRSLRDDLLAYDHVVYMPSAYSNSSHQRLHSLYKSV